METENDATVSWWLPEGGENKGSNSVPFYTFLLKVASRCNLDCDYCYIYRSPDQSWKSRPHFLEPQIAEKIGARIAEHVQKHQLSEVHVVFHGGEPLLAGAERLNRLAAILRSAISVPISFGLQTNGTLMTAEILDVLALHQIRIGMSLDGTKTINDKHRITHAGDSTYESVIRAVSLIDSKPKWKSLFGGFLAVIDLTSPPEDVFSHFKAIGARSIDLLLPDYNHDRPPPRRVPGYIAEISYGQWLARFFEVWFSEQSAMEIKYFDEILTLMLGGPSGSEAIGLTPVDLIVIETNGDIEPVDTLKTASRKATAIGMNVATHSFDDAICHPAVWSRMIGANGLCQSCQVCPELSNCGGGYIPHRFKESNGFINPSVYCEDLKFLFGEIRKKLKPDENVVRTPIVCTSTSAR